MATVQAMHRRTAAMKARLRADIEHLRRDIERIDDPRLKTMFQTSADVLSGLIKAYDDFDATEPTWGGEHVERAPRKRA
jgi:hypothetical protein